MSGCTRCGKNGTIDYLESQVDFLMGVAIDHYAGPDADRATRSQAIWSLVEDMAVARGAMSREEADERLAVGAVASA